MKINNKKVLYKGLFLDIESKNKLIKLSNSLNNSLTPEIILPHITFKFKPEEKFPDELMSVNYNIEVIGYGNNGRVEGVNVILPEILIPYYENESVPHITISCIEEAKPFETGSITFNKKVELNLKCYLGYCLGKATVYDSNNY